MRTPQNSDLRAVFEKYYGDRISDATWYRLKKIFNKDFPLNHQNVVWVAEVKRQLPKCDLRFASVVQAVQKTQLFLVESKATISGQNFVEFLDERNIAVHANTLSKWFKPLHGFRKTRVYSAQELKPIVLAAFSYKLRRENSNTVQSLAKF